MPIRTAAACEVWIWGNRQQAAAQAGMDLVSAGMVDPNSTAGASWLDQFNSILGQSTADLEKLLSDLPV